MAVETRPAPNSASKRAETVFLAQTLQGVVALDNVLRESKIQPPNRTDQAEVIFKVFPQYPGGKFFEEKFDHPFAQGRTREELLMEYATAQLARQLAFKEKQLLIAKEHPFYVHDAGNEVASIALQSALTNEDPLTPYYRAQTADLYRGGKVRALLAQTLKRVGDTHSESFQLAGHVASAERNITPAISITGVQAIAGAGRGAGVKNRAGNPVSVVEMGEAAFAESSVKDGVEQAVFDQSPTVFAVYDNLAGISMERTDSSIEGDPIRSARAYESAGLLIERVDATDLVALRESSQKVVKYARENRRPAVLHIDNLYRVTDHTSSADQKRYIAPDELKRRQGFDPLPRYKKLLAEMGVATNEQLEQLEAAAKEYVEDAAKDVLSRPLEDSRKVYNHIYASAFNYGPERISDDETAPTIDRLQSTYEPGVIYTDKSDRSQEITGKQNIQVTLGQELKKRSNLIIVGEDVQTLTGPVWRDLESVFDQRERGLDKDKYSPEEFIQARRARDMILKGQGFDVDPEALGMFAEVMQGKGNVFGLTYALDFLDRNRVLPAPINEARIIGKAIGLAMEGFVPVVEIQFGSYSSPAFEQIYDYLSSMRWRGRGQFKGAMVVRIPGMNRVGGVGVGSGGVGALGHGEALVNRFDVPGIRHAVPGDVTEMGPMLRESIRVAAEHGEVVIYHEPINYYGEKGFYQGSDKHIALGKAEVRSSGTDVTLVAWSNNVGIADSAAAKLRQEGYSVGVLNTRTVPVNQQDWDTIGGEVKKSNRVLIVEAGRGGDSRPIQGVISEHYFDHLAAPVRTLTARNVPMPAGKENEMYVVPQVEDVVTSARQLILR